METAKNIIDYYTSYIEKYEKEIAGLKQFKGFLDKTDSLFDRKNTVGHITSSAIIIDDSKILLLYHKSLDRWLQPGGHIDSTDESILESTLREVIEETGIQRDNLILVSPTFSQKMPFDIDTHHIPDNSSKDENWHFHHDFRYLFMYIGKGDIKIDDTEAKDFKWIDFEELSRDVTFSNLVEKIRHLLSFEFRTKLFYENIISKVHVKNYVSVVVSHIIPDSVYYLQAVNKILPIKAIVPKPNSIDARILELT